MPKNNKRTTTVFDPCNLPACNHSFGDKWSSDQTVGTSRATMRVIRSFFQTCKLCGWNKFLSSITL